MLFGKIYDTSRQLVLTGQQCYVLVIATSYCDFGLVCLLLNYSASGYTLTKHIKGYTV